MQQIMAFLNNYNRREQIMIIACALAMTLYLVWLLVLTPIEKKRDQLLQAKTTATQSLGRVQMLAAQIQQLRDAGSQASDENINGLIDSSLRANGLQMTGLQPGNNGEVRVRLDRAGYEPLMQWLYEMEYKQGVTVNDMSLAVTNEPGIVTVNIRLYKNP
jgi:general secretion pathway protein M